MTSSITFGMSGAALALVAACARPPEPAGPAPASPPRDIEIAPAVESEAPLPPEPEAHASLDEIREPEQPACRIIEKSWSFASLRLAAGGPVFASVTNAPTTLLLPSGQPRAPVAVFDDGHVLLRAVVTPTELELFPRVAIALGGFLIPRNQNPLRWSGGAPGTLRVEVDAASALTRPETVGDDVPCDSIGATRAFFVSRELLTKRAHLPEKLVARQGAELAVTEADAPVAALRSGLRVELLQVTAKHTRILFEDRTFSVFGWVSSADLGPAPKLSLGHGRLGGSHRTRRPFIRGLPSCGRDLPLVVELGEQRVGVGTLRSGTPFQVESAGEPTADTGAPPPRGARQAVAYLPINIPNIQWLTLADGARLLVPEDEYRKCGPPPPPPNRPTP